MRTPLFAVSLGVLILTGGACRPRVPVIDAPFSDTFDRAELGPDWLDTGKAAKLKDGKLTVANAYNHPVWLKRRLPRDVQIDFDATSRSPAGDIKIELFGDGESFDPDKGRYDPTGYMIVFGGWQNSRSIISRLGEHDEAVKASFDRVGTDPLVLPGKSYHFTVVRKGATVEWKLNGQPYLSWTDPQPLHGNGHEYFAINDWEANVSFDNLTIRPVN